jgi:serine/threonine protein kinase
LSAATGASGASWPAEELRPGDTLGRFTVTRFVGHGAMGDVWAARDPELDRDVALKLLRLRPGAIGVEATQRLRREAQAMARAQKLDASALRYYGERTDGGATIDVPTHLRRSVARELDNASRHRWLSLELCTITSTTSGSHYEIDHEASCLMACELSVRCRVLRMRGN